MSNKSSLVNIAAVAVPVLALLVGCGRTTEQKDSQPAQSSPADKTPKFAVSFSTDAPSSSPGQAKAAEGYSDNESPSFGRIVGVVKWNGPLPALDPVLVNKDTHVCAEHGRQERPSERLIVHPSNGGIKDAVLSLAGKFAHEKPLSELTSPDTLNQRKCSYEPRVFVMPVGGRLTMTSEDEVGHNVRMSGAVDLNIALSKGSRSSRRLDRPGLVQVGCDIHPWMTGYIHVVKQPYYVVTDADGRFKLTDVPVGTHQIRLWHEAWWTEQEKVAKPFVVTESVEVRASETTNVTFDCSDPVQKQLAGRASAKAGSKQVK